MFKPGNTGIMRLLMALVYSWKGFVAAWRHEEAFRQETIGCLLLLPLAIWLGDDSMERALLVSTALLVPLVELMNSAVEAVVDRFGGEMHDLSARAKDMGSAAVFMSLVILVSVWTLLLV